MGKFKYHGEWPKPIEMQHGAELFIRKPPKINNIKFLGDSMEIKFKGGFLLRVDYKQFSLMANATLQQLGNYEYTQSGHLRWPDLDEDLDIINFFVSHG